MIDLETKDLRRFRDLVGQFVAVLNKEPDLHIEIESPVSSDSQLQRVAARQRAFELKKAFKDNGLTASSVAAREAYTTGSRKPAVSLILSMP